ncbi:hypothetical protein PN498_24005 [Oscillatoria sp. CS-180]|uniref:hypothetical protein n=1 Tax=Oscillatoria sp. CS-180 TaxID=3021720 RepID=UPI00232DEB83|nr:hypothetical protein [Oscillatoria sp. CS-180]MDB9529079.1 hypothetical protein [Oscillatoria sp. CS-180]
MTITAVNQRLRDAGIRVTIVQRKQWLYLRTVLPPKPNSDKVKGFRQDITRPHTGLPATAQGIKAAERLAISLWGSVVDGSFDWETWLGKTDREQRPVKEWVSAFRDQWLSQGKTSEATWQRHWQRAFNRLPQEQPLTSEALLTTLLTIAPGTRERKRTTGYYSRLAEFAGLQIDLSPYRGDYCTGRSEVPRDLPDDALIEEWWEKIPNLQWRWVYGVIATFGVRPHEAFFLCSTADSLSWNVSNGKTGPRQTSALYPEWVEQWGLLQGTPPSLNHSELRKYGEATAQQFARYNIPFVPYDLRHAFAVRCIKFDISASIAARMMGHSVAVHTKTYQRWLSAAEQTSIYQKAIAQGPKAPSASQEQMPVSS